MFCFFGWHYCCASLLGSGILLVLHVLGLRKLPSANHCGLRPPSRELGAEGVIGALDLLPTCLNTIDYWT